MGADRDPAAEANLRNQRGRIHWRRSDIAATMPIQRRETSPSPAVARRRLNPPCRLLQQVGSGKGVQCQVEVLDVACHRADH
jgi:hypothetical protein